MDDWLVQVKSLATPNPTPSIPLSHARAHMCAHVRTRIHVFFLLLDPPPTQLSHTSTHARTYGPRTPSHTRSDKMLTTGLRCRHPRAKSSLCPRSGWRVTTPSASAPLIWSWQTPASLRSITPGVHVHVCVCVRVCVCKPLSLSFFLSLSLSFFLTMVTQT